MSDIVHQEINLYTAELRPRNDLINFSRLTRAVAGIVVVMFLVSAVQWFRAQSLESQIADLNTALQEQTRITEQVERDVASLATDQALVAEMELREDQVVRARELYNFMRNTNLGNLAGYSGHLKDLSRSSFEGMWLNQIQIFGDADSVSISGVVQRPAMLPDFVGRLSGGQSSLSGRYFDRLISTRNESQAEFYEFTLEATETE
ncbi:hypothetical protein [Pseudohongiella nitratireducens]|mgnify:CR=1 FL=1|uniref:hypothetical protein n=1 Tax=Pseudohongiella nitratireducens TaxID=1768907 RepID=UPI0024095A3C|nr:hypothetical protein [Pseudohongiella nitratireducens]MDF1622895.1 hypothetical protein [Pseudohongiella nitratireducens]|tara:strand:+ start:6315 stop:6929 length:615 start_codon:yes stop_codon:yes gene_type:complete